MQNKECLLNINREIAVILINKVEGKQKFCLSTDQWEINQQSQTQQQQYMLAKNIGQYFGWRYVLLLFPKRWRKNNRNMHLHVHSNPLSVHFCIILLH